MTAFSALPLNYITNKAIKIQYIATNTASYAAYCNKGFVIPILCWINLIYRKKRVQYMQHFNFQIIVVNLTLNSVFEDIKLPCKIWQ